MFLIAFLFAAQVAAIVPTDDITPERFPDADSVIIDDVERVSYAPDGSSETWDETWTRILTEKGRREAGTVTLSYSKRDGSGEIVSVGIIDTNGVERAVDTAATTRESTDNDSMGSNIYDPLDRRIVCRVPGLRIGETVHVKKHRVVTRPRTGRNWADLSVMEWSCPILRATYEVTAPAALPIRRKALRHSLGNVTETERKLADGSTVHTFVVTNSPQAFPEPDMPELYTQVQHVRLSTAADWREISRWYWDLCAPHLAKTNASLVAKVREIVRDEGRGTRDEGRGMRDEGRGTRDEGRGMRDDEKIRALFKFVSQEIRYMGLTLEDTSPGYAPHDVDITFDNRYGVCRDKAGLLVAMLRVAGFKAYPVLIQVGAKLDPEVPQPFFNHAVVAVELPASTSTSPSTYVLMDPTNENAKDIFPAYLCNRSYLVARPEGEELRVSPISSPADNELKIVTSAKLSKDGSLFMENDLSFGGINDTAYRSALVKKQPEERFKFFERTVKALSVGAELVKCEIEPKDMRDTDCPIRVRLAARLPEMVLRGKSRDELTVPFLTRLFGMANFLLQGSTSLETRKYPLVLDTTACVTETVTIDLGADFGAVRDLPPAMTLTGGYGYARDFSVADGVLRANRTLTVGAVEFDPDAYGRLREDIKRVEAAERKRPVFARDPLREADVRYVLEATETSLLSDRAWVTTNTVVKEVRSYAGKRASAELKFSYNPTWKNVELVSATVSNLNGRVVSVTERERNVMDCGWAASAPRYPAGKTLVVNLPAVEIGSVISYVTVTTVTNAPAAFYGAYGFDFHEPVDRRIVRVGDWRREVVKPERIPDEPNQPMSALWRDREIVTRGDFAETARHLRTVAPGTIDPADVPDLWTRLSQSRRAEDETSLARLKGIRDWMAKHVKISGPGLYDVPLERQLTEPSVVLRERYATRLDYIRTLCALLKGAGFEADVVFAAANGDDPEALRRRDRSEKPNERAFASALCRVTVRTGGFLGLGGETRTYFLGTENQYAELGATVFVGGDFFDPEEGTFGIVTVPSPELRASSGERRELFVRENGGVDMTVEDWMKGPGVAAFRKTYSEILPEDRQRKYQSILGSIAQAASATGELETDVDAYPARRKFSCFIPDFATVSDDAITLAIPSLSTAVPTATGTERRTPFAVGATDGEFDEVVVRFPVGYTQVEHLPEDFRLSDPLDPSVVWIEGRTSSCVKDGALEVTVVRWVHGRKYAWYEPKYYGVLRAWDRIETARANRTIVVRRRP